MSDRRIEQESRVPQSTEGRLAALEDREEKRDQMLAEVHAAVCGTAQEAGHGEQIRDLKKQVRVLNWIVFVMVGGFFGTLITAVGAAWAVKWIGPAPAPPTVIYVQASPPATHHHP